MIISISITNLVIIFAESDKKIIYSRVILIINFLIAVALSIVILIKDKDNENRDKTKIHLALA